MNLLVRTVALGAAVMISTIGCGGSPPTQSSSPASVSSTSTSAAPASDELGSAAVPASRAPISSASAPANLPSLPAIFSSHADPGLEAQLPTEVSGIAMGRYSISFSDLLDAGGDRASVDAFLQGIGKTEADGTFAAAFDSGQALAGGIFAFNVNGADTGALLEGITAVEKSDLGGDATTRQATVGGKSVTILSRGSGPNDTEWIYGRGDVVFVVRAADETHAAAFLQALP